MALNRLEVGPANSITTTHSLSILSPAVGPLCAYTSTAASQQVLEDCRSNLTDYETNLVPPAAGCGQGTLTNTFTWTPDEDTPDLVYYQVGGGE